MSHTSFFSKLDLVISKFVSCMIQEVKVTPAAGEIEAVPLFHYFSRVCFKKTAGKGWALSLICVKLRCLKYLQLVCVYIWIHV